MPTPHVSTFFGACASGDVEALRGLLAVDPGLVRIANPGAHHADWTGLHSAARGGHLDAVRVLLEHGADPNAREAGDNTYPLHWAAAGAYRDIVRTLLDAGGDVHGIGDAHELDAIGWATVFHKPDQAWDALHLLVERGARHHIFSAIAFGDLALIRSLVEQNPEAIDRRLSRFEGRQTPLHYAINRQRHDILSLLIELGADLEAGDANGHTPLVTAMLRGDREATGRLHAAGATPPTPIAGPELRTGMATLADSVKKGVPMIAVPDIAATLDWYTSIGFTELGRYADDGVVNFGMLSFGKAELMLRPGPKSEHHDVSLWFYTDKIDALYQLLKARQLTAAQAALGGDAQEHEGITFEEDLYAPFYGGRQFSIRDLNGYSLLFLSDK